MNETMVRKSHLLAVHRNKNVGYEATNEKTTSDDVVISEYNEDDVKLNKEHDKGNDDEESKQCHKKQKLAAAKDVTMISESKHVNDVATTYDVSLTRSHKANTVTFNVGGKHYNVSRSLLNSYPDTMLARASSNRWTDDGKKTVEPIFIERDGDRFRWILDYMRDGSVSLPFSFSKEALLHDFQYFGFDIDPQNIRLDVHVPEIADQIASLKRNQKEMITKIDNEREQIINNCHRIEREADDERSRTIELANAEHRTAILVAMELFSDERRTAMAVANTERDRLVNSANMKADKIISDSRLQRGTSRRDFHIEKRYRHLINKCLDHYLNTNELVWKMKKPDNKKMEEFERCGRYISHKTRLDFDNETKSIDDDLIMKRVLHMFGFSHIYAFYQMIDLTKYIESDDSDEVGIFDRPFRIVYEVKFGILPRTYDQSTNRCDK